MKFNLLSVGWRVRFVFVAGFEHFGNGCRSAGGTFGACGGGAHVRLAGQDRPRWDTSLVADGRAIVRACLRRNRPGRYQFLVAINFVHTDPVTDWNQLLALYDQLARLDSSPSRKPWTGALAGWRSAPGSSFWWTLTPTRQDRRPSC